MSNQPTDRSQAPNPSNSSDDAKNEGIIAMRLFDIYTRHPERPDLAYTLRQQHPRAADLAARYAARYLTQRSFLREHEPTPPPRAPSPPSPPPERPRRRRDHDFVIYRFHYRTIAKITAALGFLWGIVAALICVYVLILMFIAGETPPGDVLAPLYEKLVESFRFAGYDFDELRTMDRVLASRLLGIASGLCFLFSPLIYSLVFAVLGCAGVMLINVLLKLSGGIRVSMRYL